MPLLGKRVRADVIREHWSEILRLVASVHSGYVAPSTMLKKLAAYERQNHLHLALQEVGKVERTLFMLDWLENPDLRRRCQAGLNKGEQRHALTGAICTFRQGRIADRTHEAQQYRASGLNCAFRGSWAVISRHGGQRFHAIMGSVKPDRRWLWSQGFWLASRDRFPVILRMLSPVMVRR